MEGGQVRPLFDHAEAISAISFDLRISAQARPTLATRSKTKLKPDGNGGRKYHTWDIKAAPGMSGMAVDHDKNSRRTQEIDATEKAHRRGDERA